jgi:hypothetical protein
VWAAVFKCEEAKTDAKLRNYFHHLRIVQRAFLRTWRGEPLDTPFPEFDETLALMRWGQSYYAEAHNFLATLTSAAVTQGLPVAWAKLVERLIGRAPATTTLATLCFRYRCTVFTTGDKSTRGCAKSVASRHSLISLPESGSADHLLSGRSWNLKIRRSKSDCRRMK